MRASTKGDGQVAGRRTSEGAGSRRRRRSVPVAVVATVAVLLSVLALAAAPPAGAFNAATPWLDGWADWPGGQPAPQPYGLTTPTSALGAQQDADLPPAASTTVKGSTASPVPGNPTIRMIGDGSNVLTGELLAGHAAGAPGVRFPFAVAGDPSYTWNVSATSQLATDAPCTPTPATCVATQLTDVGYPTSGPAPAGSALVIGFGGDDSTRAPASTFRSGDAGSQAWAEGLLNTVLTQTTNERCRVWVDLPENYGSVTAPTDTGTDVAKVVGSRHAFREYFNGRLKAAASTASNNLVVARWSDLVGAHPEYLAYDGVTPSRAGAIARADLIRSALQQCPTAAGVGRAVPAAPVEVNLRPVSNGQFRVAWQAGAGPAPTGYRLSLPPGTPCPGSPWTQGPFDCHQDVSGATTSVLIAEATLAAPVTTPPKAITGVSVAALASAGKSGAVTGGDARPAPDAPDSNVHRDGGISVQLRNGKTAWFFSDAGQMGLVWATNTMGIAETGSTILHEPTQDSPSWANPPLPFIDRADVASACADNQVAYTWISSASVIPLGDTDRIVVFIRTRCSADAPTDTNPAGLNRVEHVGVAFYDYLLTSPPDVSPQYAPHARWKTWTSATLNPNLFTLDQLLYLHPGLPADPYRQAWTQVTGQTAVGGPDNITHLLTCGAVPTGTSGSTPPAMADYGPVNCFDARVGPYGLLNASSYQFWNGTAWVTDPTASTPMAMGASGGSIMELSARWVSAQNAYVLVTRDSLTTPTIRVRKATTPSGPWQDVTTANLDVPAGECPPYAGQYVLCYLSQVHPELSSSRYLAVSDYDMLRGQDHISYVPITNDAPVASAFTPLTAAKVIDTQTGLGMPGGTGGSSHPALTAGQTIALQAKSSFGLVGIPGVPTDATAVALEVTAYNPAAATTISVFPAGEANPTAAVVTAPAAGTSDVKQTSFVDARIGVFGQVYLANNSTGAAHLSVDVVGYWGPNTATSQSVLVPASTPRRVLAAPVGTTDTEVSVATDTTGAALVPAGATAVMATVIASGASSSVPAVVYASPTTPGPRLVPVTRADVLEARSNTSLLAIDGNRKLYVSSELAGTNVTIIVTGWVVPSTAGVSKGVRMVSPRRLYDSRWGATALTAGPSRKVPITGTGTVPTDATAVLVHLTAVSPPWWTNMGVRSTSAAPTTSDLSITSGSRTNLVLAPVDADGNVWVSTTSGSTQFTLDVEGYVL